ncbi:unnamed protein product, partial [Protopolystoma xenopodis]
GSVSSRNSPSSGRAAYSSSPNPVTFVAVRLPATGLSQGSVLAFPPNSAQTITLLEPSRVENHTNTSIYVHNKVVSANTRSPLSLKQELAPVSGLNETVLSSVPNAAATNKISSFPSKPMIGMDHKTALNAAGGNSSLHN